MKLSKQVELYLIKFLDKIDKQKLLELIESDVSLVEYLYSRYSKQKIEFFLFFVKMLDVEKIDADSVLELIEEYRPDLYKIIRDNMQWFKKNVALINKELKKIKD
ncbi:MAG: hypothetical protein DRM99_04280 [Thermoplasmata archaeon]|nr:MAG: hypothetical protein DRM99_04280 [Thermoplasmata archaeon]